jgi:hypothetical protein
LLVVDGSLTRVNSSLLAVNGSLTRVNRPLVAVNETFLAVKERGIGVRGPRVASDRCRHAVAGLHREKKKGARGSTPPEKTGYFAVSEVEVESAGAGACGPSGRVGIETVGRRKDR